MKYRVNLGSVVNPNFSFFDSLVEAKKAIREKLFKSFGKKTMIESSVCHLEKGVYGLGYRYKTGINTFTHGVYKIVTVKEQTGEVK